MHRLQATLWKPNPPLLQLQVPQLGPAHEDLLLLVGYQGEGGGGLEKLVNYSSILD